MSRLVCVADASALLNMRDIVIDHRTPLDWLQKEFRVRLSEAAFNELRQNRHLLGSAGGAALARMRNWMRPVVDVDRYAKCLFTSYRIPSGSGERHNCCLSFRLVLDGSEARQVIFLTDDTPACTAFGEVFTDYPVGRVWTSFDFLLFLFLRRYREIADAQRQFHEALDTLRRNIVSNLERPPSKRGRRAEKKMRRLQEQLKKWMAEEDNYRNRVDRVKEMLDCLA